MARKTMRWMRDAWVCKITSIEVCRSTTTGETVVAAAVSTHANHSEAAAKQLIVRALKETDGNRTHAAKKIGMSRRTFHRKLHEYHLEGF